MKRAAERFVGAAIVSAAVALAAVGARGQVQHVAVEGTAIDVDLHGTIVVLDGVQCTLTRFAPDLRRQMVAGGPGWEDGRFDAPSGIWARNGLDVYVADHGNHRIQRFDRALSFVSSLTSHGDGGEAVAFGYPSDITVSRQGTLFICDTENNRVVRVDEANRIAGAFGGFGGGAGKLERPVQVEAGPEDRVYVLDPPRVVVFDTFGNYLMVLGEGILRSPSRIAGDDRGIAVVDGADLVFFDVLHKPALRVALAEVLDTAAEQVLSLSLAGGRLYALTPGMLHVVADPRTGVDDGLLDKESNYR